MTTWPILIRFALAQALIQSQPALALPSLQTVSPLGHGVLPKNPSNSVKVGMGMSAVGECVVRAAPDVSTRLVRSDIASDAESAAVEALKPALSGCLTAGQTFVFSPEMLRGAVALNYYRLANRAQVAKAR